MLSILSTALDSARRILGKRKHSEPLDGQDRPDETLSEEQQNLRKRQQSAAHCSTSNAPAWSCRAYSSRGPSLGDGGSALPLSRLGSSPLELPPPMEPSDLLVLPTDLLQTIFSELALQVCPPNIQSARLSLGNNTDVMVQIIAKADNG